MPAEQGLRCGIYVRVSTADRRREGQLEALIMQRFPANGAARIAYAKSMSVDSHGDIDPTVYNEYLLEPSPLR